MLYHTYFIDFKLKIITDNWQEIKFLKRGMIFCFNEFINFLSILRLIYWYALHLKLVSKKTSILLPIILDLYKPCFLLLYT